MPAIFLFSHTGAVYGQALNRHIEELIQDIVSDVINRTSKRKSFTATRALMLAKRGILQEEETNLFPVTHQMRRVEN